MDNKKLILNYVSIFENIEVRHLVQDTQRYSMLLHTSYNPDFLQDAKDRQLFLCAVLKNVEQMQGNMEIAKLEIKDMKKKEIVIGVSVLISASLPISVYAASNENMSSRGFIIDETNEFEDIVKQILDVKSKHPEWSEQQISDFMDQIHAIKKDGVIDIWNALTSSEKKLVIRYPFDALKVNKAKEIATKQTERKFGKNGLGDRSDAFRHGIWNAEMTVLIGSEKAELFATAHEDKDTTGNESDGYTKDEHKKMDLHNNEIGRKLGADNLSAPEEKMAEIIYDEIMREDSLFVWLHE